MKRVLRTKFASCPWQGASATVWSALVLLAASMTIHAQDEAPLVMDTAPELVPAASAAADAGPDVFTITPSDAPLRGVEVDRSETAANLISISLDNVPMEDVVRLFARISGANIIATASNLQGNVTVSLKDVEWQPALRSILDMNQLALIEKTPGSGIYSIVSKPEGEPEPLITETIFLKYARVADTDPVIRPLLAPGGSLAPYPSGNALVVHSTAASLGEIRKVIQGIDKPREQVFIEAKFLELSDSAIQDLGVNWQVLQNYKISAAGLQETFTETRRRSDLDSHGAIGAQQRGWTRSRDLADDNPVAGTDVGGEQYVQDVTDVRIMGRNVTEITTESGDDEGGGSVEVKTIIPYEMERVRTAILTMDEVALVLSALKQNDGATVVSNPKIIVANEERAVIHIGQTERPFISSVTPGQQGIAPVVTYNPGDPVDFGVKVSVTPTINTEDRITLKIEPELTGRVLPDAIAPNGQSYPIIARKTIQTVFTLESGKTAAIGGLTKTEDIDAVRKIPLLGDIPILGKYLFSHSSKKKSQNETIIFVTVDLANPGEVDQKIGLPEDANLTRRHMIRQTRERMEQDEELRALQDAQALEMKEREAGRAP